MLNYIRMNLYAIFPLISCILLIICSIYLAGKKPASISYRLFAVSCFIVCLMELGHFMTLISPDITKALFWQQWVLAGLLFLPASWTLFSLTFARENYRKSIRRWGWYPALLFMLAAGFLVFMPKELLISSVKVIDSGYGFTLGFAGRYLFILVLLCLAVVLLNLENTYRLAGNEQKQKIKYSLTGICVFVGSYIILISWALLFSYVDIRFTAAGSIAIILGILLAARSIVRYGRVDTPIHVGRQAIYTSATLSIVGGYLIIVSLITKLFMEMGFSLNSFFSFLAAFCVFFLLIVIIFSRRLKNRLNLFIDRNFYKNKYDYRREWANLSEQLGTILNVDVLIYEIKRIIRQVLQVNSARVLLEDTAAELSLWLLRFGETITIKELSRRQPQLFQENKQLLEKLGAYVLVSLNVKQKSFGILVVGKKSGGQAFSKEDMELIKIISRQVSIAILNARLSEELILSQELEHFHKLSSFLIHDLKNFVSMLSMVVQNAGNFANPEFQKDSLITISGTIIKMQSLMQKLSALPKELELETKQININILIDEVISKLKIEDASSIRLIRLFNYVPQLNLDTELMQKVVLNLFLNALESMPNGGSLIIETSFKEGVGASNGSYVQVVLRDSGCGMQEEFIRQRLFKPFQSSKHKGIGIGLFQCKAIVQAHGGQILAESEANKGTSFIVKLPVK